MKRLLLVVRLYYNLSLKMANSKLIIIITNQPCIELENPLEVEEALFELIKLRFHIVYETFEVVCWLETDFIELANNMARLI